MTKILTALLVSIIPLCSFVNTSQAHCEIPCGIYDDQLRITMIKEHITTIEKSMEKIKHLEISGNDANQLTRWIINKENHANQLQDIISDYFMVQRIKPNAKNYNKKISLLHKMLIYTMQCKQTTDFSNTNRLLKLTNEFNDLYFERKPEATGIKKIKVEIE